MPDATEHPFDDLTPEQAARIDAALGESAGAHEPGEWDETVAAVSNALIPSQALPDSLRGRIASQAGAYLPVPQPAKLANANKRTRNAPWWLVFAGPIAAAAAVTLFFSVRQPPTTVLPTVAQSIDDQFKAWLARNPGIEPMSLASLDGKSEGKGELLWSDRDQVGYMRFANLPANDPTKWQYQLWIFDANRDERYPVDGGVFDAPAGGSGVVAIDPKIPVRKATLFAITREKPGGVVVSDRTGLALVAKPRG